MRVWTLAQYGTQIFFFLGSSVCFLNFNWSRKFKNFEISYKYLKIFASFKKLEQVPLLGLHFYRTEVPSFRWNTCCLSLPQSS